MSELLNMLGSRYPVIQGPIGHMNSPKLIAAICEAGAFGMLALGFSDPERTKQLLNEVRELTDKPFGANLMIANPANLFTFFSHLDLNNGCIRHYYWAVCQRKRTDRCQDKGLHGRVKNWPAGREIIGS